MKIRIIVVKYTEIHYGEFHFPLLIAATLFDKDRNKKEFLLLLRKIKLSVSDKLIPTIPNPVGLEFLSKALKSSDRCCWYPAYSNKWNIFLGRIFYLLVIQYSESS